MSFPSQECQNTQLQKSSCKNNATKQLTSGVSALSFTKWSQDFHLSSRKTSTSSTKASSQKPSLSTKNLNSRRSAATYLKDSSEKTQKCVQACMYLNCNLGNSRVDKPSLVQWHKLVGSYKEEIQESFRSNFEERTRHHLLQCSHNYIQFRVGKFILKYGRQIEIKRGKLFCRI